jgi:hypothetical protein
MRKLTPNSSPLKVKFNPNETNLLHLVSSVPKASPPQVGAEASLENLLMFATKFLCDSTAQLIMIITLAVVRSITTLGCNAILHTNLQEPEHFSLYVGDVVLNFCFCTCQNEKHHPHHRSCD